MTSATDFDRQTDLDQLAESFQVATWMHLLGGYVNNHKGLWTWLGNLETGMLSEAMADIEIRQPIYVTSLARSGSTLLLEILHRHPDLTAHRYRDYPLLFTPYLWNRYLARTPQNNAQMKERTHRDGIFITPESPEAFEEILWMAFFPDLHDHGQSAVLDGQTDNPVFEKFYRDHIRKMLLIDSGRRYLAKGNYNVTRLSYLLKLFADARFVIPVREPIWHIASLMNQHRRFCQGQQLCPRALTHLQRVGHFEFGLDRRPINTGDSEKVQQIIDLWENGAEVEGWARYWAMIHDFLADELSARPELQSAVQIVRYEAFCEFAEEGLDALFNHCRLATDDLPMAEITDMIRPPVLRQPKIFSKNDLAVIERFTSDSAQRLGLGRYRR